ncbi:glycosyl transferase group 2 family protein [Candidatus Magnetoovum chiemensis]|nr:glycosyl transferase group 2 family protein [Candidatus Magnetoovum chiemensis]
MRIAYSWECDYVNEPLAIYRIHYNSTSHHKYSDAAKELTTTLGKLSQNIPDFEKRFRAEINHYKNKIIYTSAIALFRNNKNKEAREMFMKHPFSLRMLLVFTATLFPYKSAVWLRDSMMNIFKRLSSLLNREHLFLN